MLSRPTQVQMQMQQECQAVGGEKTLTNQLWVDIFPSNYRRVDTLDSWFPGIARRIKQVPARAQ